MSTDDTVSPAEKRRLPSITRLLPWLLVLIPVLYLATLARTPVLGDPTEYTLVAHVLGIAHPPGYAFITLLGKLFQTLMPFGDIPWRMHLLSAVAAFVAALAVYGVVRGLTKDSAATDRPGIPWSIIAALFAAFTVATATDFWQHAIHANPHIITATFLAVNLYLLTRFWLADAASPHYPLSATQSPRSPVPRLRSDLWLFAFAFSAGLGLTHHPLTLFSFPAYALFILLVRPGIWRQWRTWLAMLGFALLGLSLWLYFPLRSSMGPPFGPDTLATLDGFLSHILARGLSEGLPFFALADQPGRFLVFWTLLRLQYALSTILLALVGLGWLWWRGYRPHFWLLLVAFLLNYAFVISLRAQDIMAYLLGPFLLVGLAAGIGLYGLLELARQRLRLEPRLLALLAAALVLLGPVLQISRNLPRVSLQEYAEGSAYIAAMFDFFTGQNEGAVLLNDWEHMTPLWYTQLVEARWPDPADVRPELVSTARPWVESVFAYLPGGPVYLSNYRPEIVSTGFRLRPRGQFYQVIEPGDRSIPPELTSLENVPAHEPHPQVVAYELPGGPVQAGAFVPLTLAMTAPITPTDFFVPVITVGDPAGPALTFAHTTDSHLTTPQWRAGEVIVERFDFALPHDWPAGEVPVTVQMKNLSTDNMSGEPLTLGRITIAAQDFPVRTDGLLTNFRQRVGLAAASAWNGLDRRVAPWTEENPLPARPGDTIHIFLRWHSLARAEESYTVFVHLIDPANVPYAALDYTPLGGSAPTHLWFPKWLPNQTMLDPYRLELDPSLPAGLYYIEVGLYEMTSQRRLHISDPAGNTATDRYILGPVIIDE
jgi:hypothetical protein